MITSANRISKMNGNIVIPAAEGYTVDSIGRILMENEMNDMAIFNATLRSDMYEIQARSEGTMLESELQALSENTVKDFFQKIIDKLKVFWSKLKAVFKNAYAKLTAYVVRNGKAFVAANKTAIANLKGAEKLKGECWVPKGGKDPALGLLKGANETLKTPFGFEEVGKLVNEDDSVAEMTKKLLFNDTGFDQDGNFYDQLKESFYEKKEEPTLNEAGGRPALVNLLENASAAIKALKETEKKAEKSIKKEIGDLEKAARKASNADKDEKGNKQTDEAKAALEKKADFYRDASTASCNALSTECRALIKLCKFAMAQARINLAKAIAAGNNDAHDKYKAKYESTLFESMLLEAAEEIEEIEAEDLSPEEQEMVDEIIDAVEEAIENHDDDGSDIDADECDK